MMDCQQVRRVLWPADTLRVGDALVEAALAHAEECEVCSVFLEEDRRVAQLIRDSVPRVQAPQRLRERLYTALARERAGPEPPRQSGRRSGLTLAVVGLLLAGIVVGVAGHWLAEERVSAPTPTAFVEDYLRRVVEQQELRTADRQQIASFFARELGSATPPPEVPEFEVRRAMVCLLNGRRGGVVEYEGRARRLSYYVIPLENASPPGGGYRARQVRPAKASLAVERGLGVATWRDAEHEHALVGDFLAAELQRLAPLFGCPTAAP